MHRVIPPRSNPPHPAGSCRCPVVFLLLGLLGCGTGDEFSKTPIGEVEGTVESPQGVFDLIDGLAYADVNRGGELAIMVSTWVDPGCQPNAWWRDGGREGAFTFVTASWDGVTGEPSLGLTWGDENTFNADVLTGPATLEVEPATPDGLSEGDTVEGTLDHDAVSVVFSVPYCGELDVW